VAQGSLLESSPTAASPLSAAVAVAASELAARMVACLDRAGIATTLVSASGLAASAQSTAPDAVIVSLDPESRTHMDLLRALTERLPASHVIVVAPSLRPAGVRRAVDGGADAVLAADDDLEDRLPSVVRAACAGQVCAPRELGRHIPKPALSYRERQMLGLVVLGFSNGEIAGRLHLAESTVKSHLSTAFEKLGVRSRVEAAAMVSDVDGGLSQGILAISVGAPPASRDGAPG
jgi:DNA-binding NarL/FixJ family response regulator